jgi:hypothetical protein
MKLGMEALRLQERAKGHHPESPDHIAMMNGKNRIEDLEVALLIIRAWGLGGNYNAHAIVTVRDWVDAGMNGAVPWPGGAFFEEWAGENQLLNVGGFVKFSATARQKEEN